MQTSYLYRKGVDGRSLTYVIHDYVTFVRIEKHRKIGDMS